MPGASLAMADTTLPGPQAPEPPQPFPLPSSLAAWRKELGMRMLKKQHTSEGAGEAEVRLQHPRSVQQLLENLPGPKPKASWVTALGTNFSQTSTFNLHLGVSQACSTSGLHPWALHLQGPWHHNSPGPTGQPGLMPAKCNPNLQPHVVGKGLKLHKGTGPIHAHRCPS